MHLLNAETYQLETFLDDKKRPKYAILSHTWGAEEVTYQEIANLEQARLKAGFLKIQYTCEQAIKDGWTHAWVDTCCIDKTSSAELSEAINSMFKWYQEAEICYAYLPDVESDGKGLLTPFDVEDEPEDNIDDHEAAAIKASRWSRWFTRGWTLQELIAPRRLHFFAESWNFVGVLSENAEQVSSITNIPRLLLREQIDPHSYSIARRMSWASYRVTTRAEDEAYCLLGILGVNMPLLYGEGHKAFLRLQEEVIRTTTDDSFLAWRCDSKIIRDNAYIACSQYGVFPLAPLAVSPLQFALCGHILPGTSGGNSWSMTNQGLKITLPLQQITDRLGTGRCYFTASLSCHDEQNIAHPLYIGLQCLKHYHKHYRRYSCDRLQLVSLDCLDHLRFEVKSPVNREITIERKHRKGGYGSQQRQLYIRYVSFNPYQRIELPFRPLHRGYNDKWAAPLTLDHKELQSNLLVSDLHIECTTSCGSLSGVQMQRELRRDVCSIHMAWEKKDPLWNAVRIDATRDAEIDADERGSPYQVRSWNQGDKSTGTDWGRPGCIHHLNDLFDIGAKLYNCGNDLILLIFIAPRRDTEAWKARAKALTLPKHPDRATAWRPRIDHGNFPIWASDPISTADKSYSLDSNAAPVAHIKDKAAAQALQRLQKFLWIQSALKNYERDLNRSKQARKWLRFACTSAKILGSSIMEDIPTKLDCLETVYEAIRY